MKNFWELKITKKILTMPLVGRYVISFNLACTFCTICGVCRTDSWVFELILQHTGHVEEVEVAIGHETGKEQHHEAEVGFPGVHSKLCYITNYLLIFHLFVSICKQLDSFLKSYSETNNIKSSYSKSIAVNYRGSITTVSNETITVIHKLVTLDSNI